MTKKHARDITTDRLDGILKSSSSESETEKYISKYTTGQYRSFADYFNSYIGAHGLSTTDIISKSGISQNYIYNILNDRRNPSRDKIIALGIGADMSVKEIDRGLKIAQLSPLYSKDERDARIIIAVNNGVQSVFEINMTLEHHGLEILA